ncbi:hypothetical protein SARC_07185 [Sphaeroforma arctica JP610]|uniref:Proteasome assembly chaperone 1 n=1 Tax=Sphaeroforma arctica JP610 TaxID=667725 RepID=A0A0L0FWW3_9EUKA|nr:hypothetical protein SARC_07185 [Sphaeroforma arctica JP610]KNC80448.1 hypothetical protein SARC_07185 [Sphaeroforma arctica JP610]|eukprot:XP_014154350.1 hypothetical protein SARC_07185 [Sphaeroforma arctica JP610]
MPPLATTILHNQQDTMFKIVSSEAATQCGPTVVFAHADQACISNRALYLLDAGCKNSIVDEYTLKDGSEASIKPITEDACEVPDLKVTHILNAHGVAQVSVVCLLAHIPRECAHVVAMELLDMFVTSQQLLIVSAYHFSTGVGNSSDVHAATLDTSLPQDMNISSFPTLPTSMRVNDPLLGALVNGLSVEDLPTVILATSSRRPNKHTTHSDECVAIRKLQQAVSSLVSEVTFNTPDRDSEIPTIELTAAYKLEQEARTQMYQ